MPLRWNEPYRIHLSPYHPPIIEQGGHYFYPDGCEIPLSVVAKMLDYNREFCERHGVPWNEEKWRKEPSSERESRELREQWMRRHSKWKPYF